MNPTDSDLGFGARLRLAFACFRRILADNAFAARALHLLSDSVPESAPERIHASGLRVLSALQREGRLIDFLKEDASVYSDAEIGAAARVVHAGCRKVLDQQLTLEPVLKGGEGSALTIPPGFDSRRIRLTGNVVGRPPFQAVLRHHGWVASAIRFPELSDSIDPLVLAPAEVEV